MVRGSREAGRCGRSKPTTPSAGTAAARTEIVDILAGAVLALLLRRAPDPSPLGAPRLEKAANAAVSRQIRGSP